MIISYLKLFRIPQWIKNVFVFVPLLFSQNLFKQDYTQLTLAAFFVFCLTSSIVYIFNDIVDAESDRAHPVKKFRPIASGKISVKNAVIALIVLLAIVAFSLQFFNYKFILAVVFYFVLNVLYSFFLKHIVILDVFSIAIGFMLRVLGGAFVIDVKVSSWLILTTMFISLFLGIMKRHSELNTVRSGDTNSTRKVLAYYSLNFADQMATIAAAGVIICYALYTVAERTVAIFGNDHLIYTTPFVVFGIFRYMYLVYMNKQGENTTKILVTDIPMILTVLFYIITTGVIIYHFI